MGIAIRIWRVLGWVLGGLLIVPASGALWLEIVERDGPLYYPPVVLMGLYVLAAVLGPVAALGMTRGARWARLAGWIAASVQTLAIPVFTPLGLYGLMLLACGAGESEARSASGQPASRGTARMTAGQYAAALAQNVLTVVIPIVCLHGFFRGAENLGYPKSPGVVIGLLILWACLALQLVIHECGHALVVKLVHGHIHRFQVGPLWWYREADRTRWGFSRKSAWGGRVAWTPGSAERLARQRLLVASGGPFMNLACGLIAVTAFPWLGPMGLAGAWQWVAFSGASGIAFLVNLCPVRKGYQDTDGATILGLLTNAGFRRLIEITLAQSMADSSGLRPREWPRADVEWALALEDVAPFASYQSTILTAACAHYLDSGDSAGALGCARRFETLAREQPKRCSPNGFPEAVVTLAFYSQDMEGARELWSRRPAGAGAQFQLADWLAYAAIADDSAAAVRQAWERSERFGSCGTLEYLREQLRRLEMGWPAWTFLDEQAGKDERVEIG